MTTDAERPRLRELRTDLGWTQQELADRIGHLAWMEPSLSTWVEAPAP